MKQKPYSGTPTYRTWASIIQRCTNTNSTGWHKYGARGIKVCDRWRIYLNFLEDMGERPQGKSIDRINNEGNYEPSNCRWATPYEQTHNRRKNHNSVQERLCPICKLIFKPKCAKAKYCSQDCYSVSMIGHERNGSGGGWRSIERQKRLARGFAFGNELKNDA